MIAKVYISLERQKEILEAKGWKSLTTRKLFYKIGLRKEDLEEKHIWPGILNRRYAWKTDDQYNIITRALAFWWSSEVNFPTAHYIPTLSMEYGKDKKYKLDYFNIDNVTMRLVRDMLFREDETGIGHLSFSRL